MKFIIIASLLVAGLELQAASLQGKYSEVRADNYIAQSTTFEEPGNTNFTVSIRRVRTVGVYSNQMQNRVQCRVNGPTIPFGSWDHEKSVQNVKAIIEFGGNKYEIKMNAYDTGYQLMKIQTTEFPCNAETVAGKVTLKTLQGDFNNDGKGFEFYWPSM